MSQSAPYYAHQRLELVDLIRPSAYSILDVGCGLGAMSEVIKQRLPNSKIWGIEVVPEVASKAQCNPAFAHFLCGDITVLLNELPARNFDCIIAGDVLEHLADPWRVLAGLRSKMTLNGQFICSIPNIRNFSFIGKLLFKKTFEYRDSGVMDRTHLRFFARKDIVKLFIDAGFDQIVISPLRPKKKLIKRIGRFLFGDLVVKGFLVTAISKSTS